MTWCSARSRAACLPVREGVERGEQCVPYGVADGDGHVGHQPAAPGLGNGDVEAGAAVVELLTGQISPQNLTIAAMAVGLVGRESVLFRGAMKWSLLFLLMVCLLAFVRSNEALRFRTGVEARASACSLCGTGCVTECEGGGGVRRGTALGDHVVVDAMPWAAGSRRSSLRVRCRAPAGRRDWPSTARPCAGRQRRNG